MVNTSIQDVFYLFISDEDIFARKFANEFAFHSLNHIFEEEFAEKLSKYEKIFVISPKIIKLCTISNCQTKRF